MDLETKQQLNDLYRPLVQRAKLLWKMLRAAGQPDAAFGFFNGHYAKNDAGDFVMEWFPIPVLSVPAVCDVEFAFDHVGITAKLKRAEALSFDFGRLAGHRYQVYGVDDYLADFGDETRSAADIRQAVSGCSETEIAVSFTFEAETELIVLLDFIQKLHSMVFFY